MPMKEISKIEVMTLKNGRNLWIENFFFIGCEKLKLAIHLLKVNAVFI